MKQEKSETWLDRMRLARGRSGAAGTGKAATVGVLAFEVALLMSKAAQLWCALGDDRMARLRGEVLRLEGVRRLVSDDDDHLLALALAEMTGALAPLARAVARLSRRCSDPMLQRFDAAFADLVKNGADPFGLEYAGRKMERKVKKMERFVAAGAELYQALEVLAEMEQGLRRVLANTESCRHRSAGVTGFKNKVVWQRQQVKCLREASLWVRTYDYVVRLLGRSLFSIVGRIRQVFRFQLKEEAFKWSVDHQMPTARLNAVQVFASGPLAVNNRGFAGQCLPGISSRTRWPISGGPFGGCVAGGYESFDSSCRKPNDKGNMVNVLSMIEPRFQFLNARASTLGAAALGLHYANVITVIKKLAASPHLIDADERDDLYDMLTTSIKAALRVRLKSNAKKMVYDPVLAAEWSAAMTRILEWLAPLAYNMIRWQADRNFEQRGMIPSSNVLLLETLHFADQKKTENAITELLVGLNYLWRYGRELDAQVVSVRPQQQKS